MYPHNEDTSANNDMTIILNQRNLWQYSDNSNSNDNENNYHKQRQQPHYMLNNKT